MDDKPPPYEALTGTETISGFVQPGILPQVEPPRQLWFMIAKYFLAIVNGIQFGVAAITGFVLLILTFLITFTDKAHLGFLFFFLAVLCGLLAVYFYKIPVEGALKENPKKLVIHGILQTIFFIEGLNAFSGPHFHFHDVSPEFQRVLDKYYAPSSIATRLITCFLQIGACFAVANLLNKEQRARAGRAFPA